MIMLRKNIVGLGNMKSSRVCAVFAFIKFHQQNIGARKEVLAHRKKLINLVQTLHFYYERKP